MKTRSLTVAAPAALAGSFAAAFAFSAAAGTVTLTNDDEITGKITSNTDEAVVVEHADLGTLNIDKANVESLTLKKTDPAYVEPPVPDFFFGWDKTLAAGITGSDGNTDAVSLYASFDTGYENDETRWQIDADVFYSENEGVNTRNYYQAGLTKDWLIPGERHFYFANAKYENDRFTGWQERTSGYGGMGYEFINNDDNKNYNLIGRAGAGGAYEAGVINDFTPELYLGLEGKWTIDDNSSLKYYTYFYPSLDPAFSEFRNTSGLAYQIDINKGKGLSLKMGAENQYNSAAAPGTEENDLKYYAALVYDF